MPKITKNIIIINVLCWLCGIVAARHGVDFTQWFGLHFMLASVFHFYQLFTYLFMHGGFEHLFFNMFAVFMFGRTLEQVWGERRFLTYYILCGIGAGVMQEAVQLVQYYTTLQGYTGVNLGGYVVSIAEYLNMMTTVGASGAVYGILLAFGMLFPNEQIYLYFVLPLKAKWFVVGYALLELLLGLSQRGDGVALFAHCGGMLIGCLLSTFCRRQQRRRRNSFYGGGDSPTLVARLKGWFARLKRSVAPQQRRRTYHFRENTATRKAQHADTTDTAKKDEEIEAILQKIKQSGYSSLTTEEKQRIFNASKK